MTLPSVTTREGHGASRISSFEVRLDDSSPGFTIQTMQHLPSFLSVRPITRLWISIDGLTRAEVPWAEASDASWCELLSSVPYLEELALSVDIWDRSLLGSALIGSADALFSALKTSQDQNGLYIACPRLRRISLVLATPNVSVNERMRGIRDLVRFRYGRGAPLCLIHLAVERGRVDDVNRDALLQEMVNMYRVKVVVLPLSNAIGFPVPQVGGL